MGGAALSNILPKYAASLIGLAFFCAMLRAPFFNTLVTEGVSGPAMLRFMYDASMIVLGIALVFLGMTRLARGLNGRGVSAMIAAGLATALGMAIINACRLWGIGAAVPYFAGVLLLSVGLVSVAAIWFHRLADLPRDCIPSLVLAAFVVSHVSCLLDMLPQDVAALASMLYPLGSLAAFLVASAKEPCGETPAHPAQIAQSEGEHRAPDGYFRKIRSLSLVLIIAELVCGAFLRSRWAHGGVGFDPAPGAAFAHPASYFITYLVSAIIGVLLLLIVRRAKSAAEASLVIGGAGMVVFLLATAAFATSPVSLLSPVVTGLYSALLVYLIALIAPWSSDGDCSSLACVGAFSLIYGSISGLTSSVIPALLSFRGIMPDDHLATIGVVAGLVMSVGVCVVLFSMVVVHRSSYLHSLASAELAEEVGTEAASSAASDDACGSPVLDPLHEQAMDVLAEAFGLTRRERETASLISRGYTAKRVADELHLTLGTVQGYAKSVYRKMGIHKKDELIEAVSQARRGL